MSSRRQALRRTQLERNLQRLRSSTGLVPVSGRVRALTPPPASQAREEDAPEEASELEQLRASLASLKRLQEVIHFLGGAPDLSTLRGELLDLAISLSGLPRGMLALKATSDDGSRRFKIQAKRGFDDPRVQSAPETRVLRNILNHCLESGEALLEGNARAVEQGGILGHAADKGLRLGAVACLPLQAGGATLGALVLDDPNRRAPFSSAEGHLLRSFARHAAVALARVAEQSRLRRQAALLQRRNERLEAELEAASRRTRQVQRSSEQLRAHRTEDKAGKALRRLLAQDYPGAKQGFTRRYLAELMREVDGDLRRASERAGLPLARLIGLLDHLGLGSPPRPPG